MRRFVPIILIAGVAAAVGTTWFVFFSPAVTPTISYQEPSTNLLTRPQIGEEITVRGKVMEKSGDRTVDSSEFLVLKAGRESFSILYHYGEYPPCKNEKAADDGFGISPGDEVEVFGKLTYENGINTCDDETYYIRKIQ